MSIATHSRWNGSVGTEVTLTWSFADTDLTSILGANQPNYPNLSTISNGDDRTVVRSAFALWDLLTGVDFVEVSDSAASNVRIGAGLIDGNGGAAGLATWWLSPSGDTSLAAITIEDASVGLYGLALHEVGHVIGLDHSTDPNDLMAPVYVAQGLTPNDIIAARSMYNSGLGLLGTSNDDQLIGSADGDAIWGFEGADTILAGEDSNIIVGGLDSNDGPDFITAGTGNDLIYGNGGADTIQSTGGNDIIVGGFGADKVTTGDGSDIVYGNQGSDTLDAGSGNNLVYAGRDDDHVTVGSGNDTVTGNEGDDVIAGGDGNNFILGGNSILDSIADLDGNDRITTGSGNDTIYGGRENDTIEAGAGDDLVVGGDGNDNLIAGGGNDTLYGGTGIDVLTGGEGADVYVIDSPGNSVTIYGFNSLEGDRLYISGGVRFSSQDGNNVFYGLNGGSSISLINPIMGA
jgi:Ca2+-binding RTX toxin-like protein